MEIKLNPTQYNFLQSESKFTFFTGGYKAGKTFVLARKAFNALVKTKEDGLLASPTYRMNSDLLQPEIEHFFRDIGFSFNWRAGDSLYETPLGKILIRTLEKRSSLEGHNIGWFGVDEIDLLKKHKAQEDWRVLISKLVKGKKQYGFGVGTNEGFEFVYDKFVENKQENYELFQASTLENKKNLPDDYIEIMYQNFDKLLAKRYIEGLFVNIVNLPAYYAFTKENVIEEIKKLDIDKEQFLYVGADFNVDPLAWVIGIKRQNQIIIFDELYIRDANTKKTCQLLKKKYPKHKIKIYPDMTGKSRKTSATFTDIQLLRLAGFQVYGTYNPAVKDRLNIVNNCFEKKQIMITKNNKYIIRDLEQCSKDDYGEVDKTNLDLSHSSDGLGYLALQLFPIKRATFRTHKNG